MIPREFIILKNFNVKLLSHLIVASTQDSSRNRVHIWGNMVKGGNRLVGSSSPDSPALITTLLPLMEARGCKTSRFLIFLTLGVHSWIKWWKKSCHTDIFPFKKLGRVQPQCKFFCICLGLEEKKMRVKGKITITWLCPYYSKNRVCKDDKKNSKQI